MAALVAHAAAWSALELAPTAAREPVRAAPAALVWLETPTVLTANADTDADARQITRVTPRPQARVRPRASALMARTCASAPSAVPALEVPAPVLTGASADGSPSGSAAQAGTPVLAAGEGAGLPGSGAREGAPAPRAQLLSNHPCAGYFPGEAAVDVGEVQVDVAVDVRGHAALSSVLLERPLGQGFAQAAQACARKLLFAPAHDGSGAAVPVHAKLRLVFKRV